MTASANIEGSVSGLIAGNNGEFHNGQNALNGAARARFGARPSTAVDSATSPRSWNQEFAEQTSHLTGQLDQPAESVQTPDGMAGHRSSTLGSAKAGGSLQDGDLGDGTDMHSLGDSDRGVSGSRNEARADLTAAAPASLTGRMPALSESRSRGTSEVSTKSTYSRQTSRVSAQSRSQTHHSDNRLSATSAHQGASDAIAPWLSSSSASQHTAASENRGRHSPQTETSYSAIAGIEQPQGMQSMNAHAGGASTAIPTIRLTAEPFGQSGSAYGETPDGLESAAGSAAPGLVFNAQELHSVGQAPGNFISHEAAPKSPEVAGAKVESEQKGTVVSSSEVMTGKAVNESPSAGIVNAEAARAGIAAMDGSTEATSHLPQGAAASETAVGGQLSEGLAPAAGADIRSHLLSGSAPLMAGQSGAVVTAQSSARKTGVDAQEKSKGSGPSVGQKDYSPNSTILGNGAATGSIPGRASTVPFATLGFAEAGVFGSGNASGSASPAVVHGEAEISGNPFQAMDSEGKVATGHSLSSASTELQVGYQDPVLGYVELRAHADGGGVHASLGAQSAVAGETLAGHLSSLAGWMNERHTPVESLTVLAPHSESDSRSAFQERDSKGDGMAGGYGAGQQNAGGGSEDGRGGYRDESSSGFLSLPSIAVSGPTTSATSSSRGAAESLFTPELPNGGSISVLA
jgi:hypothetical protein